MAVQVLANLSWEPLTLGKETLLGHYEKNGEHVDRPRRGIQG